MLLLLLLLLVVVPVHIRCRVMVGYHTISVRISMKLKCNYINRGVHIYNSLNLGG